MDFTLFYRGPLKANGGPADKHGIRLSIHRQLKVLWRQRPLVDIPDLLSDPPRAGNTSLIRHFNGFRFAPLISPTLAIVAELSITLLRPEAPGALITQGGDIDNRLKTLLDALRMPKTVNEIPKGEVSTIETDPFYCLLEDDNLVTKLTVSTDRLLEPVSNQSEVQLLIHVNIKRVTGTWGNAGLG